MTYKQMADQITAEQKLKCDMRGLPFIRIQLGLLYQLISNAETEVQQRTSLLRNFDPIDFSETQTYVNENDIPYVNESGLYYVTSLESYIFDLPNDYSTMENLFLDGEEVEYLDPADFYDQLEERSELVYTIVAQDGKHLLKFGPTSVIPSSSNVVLPVYFITVRPYMERKIAGTTDLIFPNDYQDVIKLGVMKEIFEDYHPRFERRVESLKRLRNSDGLTEVPGSNLGGIGV